MPAKLQEPLTPADAEVILGRSLERAAEIEMAIASFLDSEALGFADCKLERGQ